MITKILCTIAGWCHVLFWPKKHEQSASVRFCPWPWTS